MVDIYRDAKRRGTYPPLFTDPEGDITIEFMFAGINMFWARLRLILNESEKGPKHIYAQEHKLYYYYYHFGGH